MQEPNVVDVKLALSSSMATLSFLRDTTVRLRDNPPAWMEPVLEHPVAPLLWLEQVTQQADALRSMLKQMLLFVQVEIDAWEQPSTSTTPPAISAPH